MLDQWVSCAETRQLFSPILAICVSVSIHRYVRHRRHLRLLIWAAFRLWTSTLGSEPEAEGQIWYERTDVSSVMGSKQESGRIGIPIQRSRQYLTEQDTAPGWNYYLQP